MAYWNDGLNIDVRKIDNGYLVDNRIYFRTKKEVLKYVSKLIQEYE